MQSPPAKSNNYILLKMAQNIHLHFKMEQTESSVARYLASNGLDGSASPALLPDIKYQALPLLICALFISFCSASSFPI